jgi:hypothetical protein
LPTALPDGYYPQSKPKFQIILVREVFFTTPAKVNVVSVSGLQYPSQNSSTPLDVGGEDARVDGQNNETTGQSYTIPVSNNKTSLLTDSNTGSTSRDSSSSSHSSSHSRLSALRSSRSRLSASGSLRFASSATSRNTFRISAQSEKPQ